MKLEICRCITVHDVLCELLDVSHDIDEAARSLAFSEYCPKHEACGNDCSRCWKAWLESEVTIDES